MSNGKQTIVEEGTELRGTLASTCPVVVRGRVDGEIQTPSLLVSENGAVHGRAKVGMLRSQGEVSGEFDADTVELAGRVRDNTVIRAKSLEVKLSSDEARYQVMFGECELSVGDAPRDEVALTRRDTAESSTKPDGRLDSEPPSEAATAISTSSVPTV